VSHEKTAATEVQAAQSTTQEVPSQARREYPSVDAALARSAIISETMVFCTLVLLGGALFAIVAITNINWYYPTVFYGVVAYVGWQRYLSVSFKAQQVSEQATIQRETAQAAQEATQVANKAAQRTAEASYTRQPS
jgi:hypothetical protein